MVKPKGRKKDTSTPPMERSKNMTAWKQEKGLPTQKDIQLLESKGLFELVNEKIARMGKYAAAQRVIAATIAATGWSLNNVIERITDLEVKLVEYGDDLESKGINPITDKSWCEARNMLMKDIAFAHKHGLEVTKFQKELIKSEEKNNEDVAFKVE